MSLLFHVPNTTSDVPVGRSTVYPECLPQAGFEGLRPISARLNQSMGKTLSGSRNVPRAKTDFKVSSL